MDTKHRYRLLIYFAALVLCLSVCFANAEELQPVLTPADSQATELPLAPSQAMIFESAHGHSAFMPVLQQAFVVTTPLAVAEHVVPQSVLDQVTESNRPHHFWHGAQKHRVSLVVDHQAKLQTGETHGTERATNAGQSE